MLQVLGCMFQSKRYEQTTYCRVDSIYTYRRIKKHNACNMVQTACDLLRIIRLTYMLHVGHMLYDLC